MTSIRKIRGFGFYANAPSDSVEFTFAALAVRLFEAKKSSKKSGFGENRLRVRLFEAKKSSFESSIGKTLW